MSDSQRPEREAMQRCYCGPRECLHPANLQPGYQCAVVLAALPPTPTPGLETWLKEREVEAVAGHNAAAGVSRAWWSGRVDTLRDVIALLLPAHAGGRE
jgi:hypothetical protein